MIFDPQTWLLVLDAVGFHIIYLAFLTNHGAMKQCRPPVMSPSWGSYFPSQGGGVGIPLTIHRHAIFKQSNSFTILCSWKCFFFHILTWKIIGNWLYHNVFKTWFLVGYSTFVLQRCGFFAIGILLTKKDHQTISFTQALRVMEVSR